MLHQLSPWASYFALAILGAATGAAINWAIYQLAMIRKRVVSPWQTGQPDPVAWSDRIPIAGWWLLRRRERELGRLFWIRPMLLEIVWMVGLPWFWYWQLTGGLTDGTGPPAIPGHWVETWFWGHTVLLALFFAATFIDFDEKTIPDGITVTGVIFALILAAVAPSFRLPLVVNLLGGDSVESLHFNTPQDLPTWHHDVVGLWIGIAIFSIWVLALLPKLIPLEGPLFARIRFMVASIVRPPRKTNPKFGNTRRGMRPLTRCLLSIWCIGIMAIAVTWWVTKATANWDSLFGALVGLGFGGGVIWGIRIIGSLALNQEAMGFGDVTLMAMVGAFVGWQATLLALPWAFFAALVFAVINLVIRSENELAFGPYLCFGAAANLFLWPAVWPVAERSLFAVGGLLIAVVLLGAAIAMYPMLIAVRAIRTVLFPFDEDEHEESV